MGIFERYLSLWVLLCMLAGIALGHFFPGVAAPLANLELYHINLPVAVLIWMMIFPMMAAIDFESLPKAGQYRKGVLLISFVNYAIKPFSMFLLAWLFFQHIFAPYLTEQQANEFQAGLILLGAAPCTAMVFVWSYLSKGNATYTLVQVAVNDLLMLLLFVPIVGLLLGISDVPVPYGTLTTSLLVFVVLPLLAGWLANRLLVRSRGMEWYTQRFLPRLKPLSVIGLLLILILLFAFQGSALLKTPILVLLIAVPLLLQTYLIYGLGWTLGRKLGLPYQQCAPGAMIGASNFFELSVAVAIALFGLDSGAALATVVGVLIEVPVMLSLVALSKRWSY